MWREMGSGKNLRSGKGKGGRFTTAASAFVECLEHRLLLSIAPLRSPAELNVPAGWRAAPNCANNAVSNADGSSSPYGLTPAQMQGAYGLTNFRFGAVSGNGAGQTIAIVDAYDDPHALSDLNAFSTQFSLPLFNNGGSSPSFSKLNQAGAASPLPGIDPVAPSGDSWEVEESLDIEWAHVTAPDANIVLVEANDDSGNLYTADQAAANIAGVSVVSNSWGGAEYSGETTTDSIFNHTGVTFVVSTGDSGAYASGTTTISPQYPSVSPNVIAVGGTTLTVGANNTYGSESAWGNGTSSGKKSGGGGGISAYEPIPSYQVGKINGLSSSHRTYPDVSMEADPSAPGVALYDSTDFGASTPWLAGAEGGTSLSTPMWSGLIAVADQGRVIGGYSAFTGATQALPALYTLPASSFHDITTGNNGYAAGGGYDLASGIGTPIANLLLPALVPTPATAPIVTANPSSVGVSAGQNASFTAAASGSPAPTVQWQISTDGGKTFANITGNASATTTTLTLTSVSASQNGNQFRAVFTNSVNSATSNAATLSVTPSGTLSGQSAAASSSYNLTSLGTADWAHWGRGGTYGNFDHKAAGGSQISNVTTLGSGASYGGYSDNSRNASWTDGTPDASDTSEHGYIWANNVIGAGYSFTVPADTATRTLYIYAGGYSSGSTLTAHLSDGSSADVVFTASGNAIYTNLYTITYKAASAGQKLTISYVKSTNINGAGGSVDLIAAVMPGAPTQDTIPPQASLKSSPSPITSPSQSATFAVVYTDNVALNLSQIPNSILQLNGYPTSRQANYSSETITNSATVTATYVATAPPSGGWTTSDNGTYSIVLPASLISDSSNNFTPATTLGTFQIAIPAPDATPPQALLQPTSTLTSSVASETLNVVYTDNVAVNEANLATGNLALSGPTSQTAKFVSASPSSNSATITATYSVAAPAGGWTTAANGTYLVSLAANSVSDTSGNFASAATLGNFQIAIPAPGAAR